MSFARWTQAFVTEKNQSNGTALRGKSPAASVPRSIAAERDGDANPTARHNDGRTASSITNPEEQYRTQGKLRNRKISHYISLLLFFYFLYQLAGSFCASIQYFSEYINEHTDRYTHHMCSLCLQRCGAGTGRRCALVPKVQ